ncbi:MAG: DNA-directed RNA polymerase sigma-70 factor [Cyclobacteriaceae bacterium]|nr:MAG: DNA-directed RNA polymerase sigma-70 factor [Cyclobacteriaceae bacterium]
MGLKLYKSLSEEALVSGCRRRDQQAQRMLYEKYSPAMYPLCLRYVKEKSEAEDIMISGFMKAFDKIDGFTGKGSLGGWIRRIMINQALSHLRKNKSVHVHLNSESTDYQPHVSISGDHLEAEDLMNLVCKLPVGYRTVFNLYAIEGYSHKEISEVLGISENTSKSQLSRARGLLQKQILKENESIETKLSQNE